jgi:hypothetical protein
VTYNYQDQRPCMFTDDGQRMLLKIRDNANRLCKTAGVVRMDKIMLGVSGDTWGMLACADRLIELGDLREIDYGQCAAQHRIFVWIGEAE